MDQKIEKVCLIVNDYQIANIYYKEVEKILSETDVTITMVAIDETTIQKDTKNDNSREDDEKIKWRDFFKFAEILCKNGAPALLQAERHIARVFDADYSEWLSKQFEQASKRKDINAIPEIKNAEIVRFTPQTNDRLRYTLPTDIISKIEKKADVALLLGFNRIIIGDILEAPPYGVLSYHWSDIRKYRGRPGCLWQYLNNEDEIGFTIQQLTDRLDGGRVIHCEYIDISDVRTWREVRLRATQIRGTGIYAKSINKLNNPDFEPIDLSEEDLGELTHSSDGERWSVVLQTVIKNLVNRYHHIPQPNFEKDSDKNRT